MHVRNFFAQLKRRHVYRVAIAYAVVAWLLTQVATQVLPFFEIPNWAVRLVVLLLMIGFPVALVLAWAFDLTPEGIKRTDDVGSNEYRPRWSVWKFVAVIVTIAMVAAALLTFQLVRSKSISLSPVTTAASALAEKSIAVRGDGEGACAKLNLSPMNVTAVLSLRLHTTRGMTGP
jgi:magnesium-transporting ATPase (P-type)